MLSLYITPFEYKKATTGQEIASLVGNLSRVGTPLVAGGTTLNLYQGTTVALSQYDEVAIFDGPNSEVVVVGVAGAGAGTTNIPISPAQFNHAAGVVICSDGQFGSLPEAIKIASSLVEDICYQSLMAATYTEQLELRTMAASINNEMQLNFRPRHFPVTGISALSLESSTSSIFPLDPAQAIIESKQRMVNVPVMAQVGTVQAAFLRRPPLSQTDSGFVNFTYTAGFTYANMPWAVKQACILLTSLHLSDRLNPTGAADYQAGAIKNTVYLRGDLSGESSLYKRAVALLQLYTRDQ